MATLEVSVSVKVKPTCLICCENYGYGDEQNKLIVRQLQNQEEEEEEYDQLLELEGSSSASSSIPSEVIAAAAEEEEEKMKRSFEEFKETLDTFWKLSYTNMDDNNDSSNISKNGEAINGNGDASKVKVAGDMERTLSELLPPIDGYGAAASSSSREMFAHPCCDDCFADLLGLQEATEMVDMNTGAKETQRMVMVKLYDKLVRGRLNFTCLESRWVPVRSLLIMMTQNLDLAMEEEESVAGASAENTEDGRGQLHEPSAASANSDDVILSLLSSLFKKQTSTVASNNTNQNGTGVGSEAAAAPIFSAPFFSSPGAFTNAPHLDSSSAGNPTVGGEDHEAEDEGGMEVLSDWNGNSSSSSSSVHHSTDSEPRAGDSEEESSSSRAGQPSQRSRSPTKRLTYVKLGDSASSANANPCALLDLLKRHSSFERDDGSSQPKRVKETETKHMTFAEQKQSVEERGEVCFCDGCGKALQNIMFMMCTQCVSIDEEGNYGFDLCLECYRGKRGIHDDRHEMKVVRHLEKKSNL